MAASFDDLIDEANAAPVAGWDFSWLDGRATEERPSWRYRERLADRAADARHMLDLDAGGAELLGELPVVPPLLVAAESWAPNIELAARRLEGRGHVIVPDARRKLLPLRSACFDLVTSRHPVDVWWDEIARVLEPGGTYFSQQVGPHSVSDLSEWFLGPVAARSTRDPETLARAATAAGLIVSDIRQERLPVTFLDVGAVVYFLRLVIWIVPGFDVRTHREQLRRLHDRIVRDGSFVTHSSRLLVEATKPA